MSKVFLMNLVLDKTGHGEVIALFDEKIFCGFVSILMCNNIVHIIYFAIEEMLRNKGYGASTLLAIENMYPESRIIVDVEELNVKADNNQQRVRRKKFYLKNGFVSTSITYKWKNETYNILAYGGNITDKEFREFWRDVYSSSILLQDF
jgi:GNAT superfamily N-acetyltransferase